MFKITKNDREYTYKILPEQYVIEKAKIQIGKKIKEIEKIIQEVETDKGSFHKDVELLKIDENNPNPKEEIDSL